MGITSISGIFSGLLPFANGGIVPGALGQPQIALVHGGEEVIPFGRVGRDKMAMMTQPASQPIINNQITVTTNQTVDVEEVRIKSRFAAGDELLHNWRFG